MDHVSEINKLKAKLQKSEAKIKGLEHDIYAYRGCLGYPLPDGHFGNLWNGQTPRCKLCEAKDLLHVALKTDYDRLEDNGCDLCKRARDLVDCAVPRLSEKEKSE